MPPARIEPPGKSVRFPTIGQEVCFPYASLDTSRMLEASAEGFVSVQSVLIENARALKKRMIVVKLILVFMRDQARKRLTYPTKASAKIKKNP